jgi:hypothetical protein
MTSFDSQDQPIHPCLTFFDTLYAYYGLSETAGQVQWEDTEGFLVVIGRLGAASTILRDPYPCGKNVRIGYFLAIADKISISSNKARLTPRSSVPMIVETTMARDEDY